MGRFATALFIVLWFFLGLMMEKNILSLIVAFGLTVIIMAFVVVMINRGQKKEARRRVE